MDEMMKVKELGKLVEFSEMDESAWDYIDDFDMDYYEQIADLDYTEDFDGDYDEFCDDYIDILLDEEFEDLFNVFYG